MASLFRVYEEKRESRRKCQTRDFKKQPISKIKQLVWIGLYPRKNQKSLTVAKIDQNYKNTGIEF